MQGRLSGSQPASSAVYQEGTQNHSVLGAMPKTTDVPTTKCHQRKKSKKLKHIIKLKKANCPLIRQLDESRTSLDNNILHILVLSYSSPFASDL